ncbi:MAG: hypothetical protein V3T22_09430 [Planctomycetota bacterium]
MKRLLAGALVCPFLPACLIVSVDNADPSIDLTAVAATKYVHRGMVNNSEGVAQGEIKTTLPAKWWNQDSQGRWWARAWGNVDLSNDTGDAWFPDGHAGEFSEIDIELGYAHTLGRVDLSAGIIDYILSNGLEFITNSPARGARGETKEFFVTASIPLWAGITPFVSGNWDFDEVKGFYGRTGLSKTFRVGSKLTVGLSAAVGYSDEEHAAWTYGQAPGFSAGLVDFLGEVRGTYTLDEHTEILLTGSASSIIDDEQEAWFNALGIDSNNTWLLFGFHWSY